MPLGGIPNFTKTGAKRAMQKTGWLRTVPGEIWAVKIPPSKLTSMTFYNNQCTIQGGAPEVISRFLHSITASSRYLP